MRVAGAGLGAILVVVSASAEDWPRFRGANGSGLSAATGLPTEFGPTKNLLWKTSVPFARSSPVIAGSRIFLTAVEKDKLVTLCLDRATGKIAWRREIPRARVTSSYKNNDGASPTPVTDGKNVYVFFPDLGLISYGPDGNERWRLSLGPFDTFYGLGASPILAGDTLLMICDVRTKPFLVAVDIASGKVRWRVERSNGRLEAYATPLVWEPEGQPAQVIVLGARRISAYSIGTGELLWWVGGLGSFPVGSPILGAGLAVFTTFGSDGSPGPSFDESLKASDKDGDGKLSSQEAGFDEFGGIDTNSDGFIDRAEWDAMRDTASGDFGMIAVRPGGRGDLTKTAIVWHNKKTYDTITTPLIHDGVMYVIKSGGIIASFDPVSGEPFKVDRTKDAMEPYWASPVAADGKILFLSETGKITVIKAGRQWEILAVNDLGEECYATPAISSGALYFRTRSALYAFGQPAPAR